MKSEKGRRDFLKKTSLTTLSLGLLPLASQQLLGNDLSTNDVNACNPTTLDYYGEGPFYTANPPSIVNNKLAKSGETGTPMIISGRVTNLDCTEAIPNAIVDVWHANDAGQYDNTSYNLRGQTKTNTQGYYVFETIKPGKYLNGAQYRPSHIHFKITAPGKTTLTTQLYFKGDTSIPIDAAASINSGTYDASNRIIELKDNGSGTLEGTWDIVVDGDGIKIDPNSSVVHIDKGMIYEAGPNPFSDEIRIRFGVFQGAEVGLAVFNIQGNKVATLESSNLQADKYEVVWQPDSGIPNGFYFIALTINDLQVHYLKVSKID
tara:strand:- start:902 stop:1858 length:957 start_codon:yes stop_codon:yes gene_type:complete